MRIKLKNININIDILLILILILTIINKNVFIFYYYYFISYFFIMIHEFSHVIIAKLFKIKTNEINFKLGGMCANIENLSKNKIINIIIFSSGPISNLLIYLIFNNNLYIRNINSILFFVNLIPIYPLDGYKILTQMFKEKTIKKIKMLINSIVIIVITYIILHKKMHTLFVIFIYILNLKIQNKEVTNKNK